ncbi:MAG: hypothetical protein ISS74_07630 [Planctomycetes bacterium]|nr:hypothetical protein [Planctomycetota bacterium]
MSTDAFTQTGRTPADAPGASPDAPGPRQPPHVLIQESIKYRRRAQDAERRVEALEAELSAVQGGRDQHAAGLEAQLDQALAEADTLRRHLADLERDRSLERELARAGAADTETALALAHQRLADADTPDDLAAFAKALLEEKPHLRGGPRATVDRPAALPPKTSGAKPAGADDPRRASERLADRARTSGRPGDVMAYMRARRGTTV